MKVTLIVCAITVATLGMLYVVAQPTHAQNEQTGTSLSKSNTYTATHGMKEL